MSSTYGENLKLSIFGQSHGPAIGMTLDGIPAGLPVDLEKLQTFLNRRAPGQNDWSTPRREEDRPEKTLFVITTDGMENASRKYSYEKLKAMIQRQQEKFGWEFLFLGANIDAAKEAARFGITEDRAANYHADRQGTAVVYEAMSEVVCNVRANRPMSKEWKRNVDEDYKKRGGK